MLLDGRLSPCGPAWRAVQAGAALGSSLRCHHQLDQYPEMHCTGANLALDLRAFAVRQGSLLPDSVEQDTAGT